MLLNYMLSIDISLICFFFHFFSSLASYLVLLPSKEKKSKYLFIFLSGSLALENAKKYFLASSFGSYLVCFPKQQNIYRFYLRLVFRLVLLLVFFAIF